MSVLHRAGRLLLVCLAGILLEHVQAYPPARSLLDKPAPSAAPESPAAAGHKHQDPSKQHSRKFGIGSALGGFLSGLGAPGTETNGSRKDAAQVKFGQKLCPWNVDHGSVYAQIQEEYTNV